MQTILHTQSFSLLSQGIQNLSHTFPLLFCPPWELPSLWITGWFEEPFSQNSVLCQWAQAKKKKRLIFVLSSYLHLIYKSLWVCKRNKSKGLDASPWRIFTVWIEGMKEGKLMVSCSSVTTASLMVLQRRRGLYDMPSSEGQVCPLFSYYNHTALGFRGI